MFPASRLGEWSRLDRGVLLIHALAVFTFAMLTSATAEDAATAARSLGYALQAGNECEDLIVLLQTEARLERRFGKVLRGEHNALNDEFHRGAMRFLNDLHELGSARACALAFDRVGPDGSEFAGLILTNSFGNADGPTHR